MYKKLIETVKGGFEIPKDKEEVSGKFDATVIIFKPAFFDEIVPIGEALKSGSSVILNTEKLKKEDIVRFTDYLSGVVFALDGSITKASSCSYFIASDNVNMQSTLYDI